MKRTILLISVVAFVIACGDDGDSGPTIPPANNLNNTNNVNNTNNTNNLNNTNNTNNLNNTNNTNNLNNTNNTNNLNNTGGCPVLNPGIGECDPLCQSGCSEGESCFARQDDPEVLEFTSSCTIPGAGVQGDTCETDGDCAGGFMCVSLDGGDAQCRQYCRANAVDEPQCPNAFTCRPFQLELRVGVCDQPVDECSTIPDSCSEEENCYDTPNGKRCAPFDTEAMPGDACTNSTDCGDGYRCVGSNGNAEVCRRICDPNDVDICDPGSTCQGLTDEDGAPLDWGACFSS